MNIGLPTGNLEEATFDLFRRAGYTVSRPSSRDYHPTIRDPELQCTLLRSQEIPRYVFDGELDVGITGMDWVEEERLKFLADREDYHKIIDEMQWRLNLHNTTEVCELAKYSPEWDVVSVAEFSYSKSGTESRWVLAVHADSPFRKVGDLSRSRVNPQHCRVATEAPYFTRQYFHEKGCQGVVVKHSHGATEAKPPRLTEAIVTVSDTGTTLSANSLRILDTVFVSRVVLIARRTAWGLRQAKILEIASRLLGVVEGRLME